MISLVRLFRLPESLPEDVEEAILRVTILSCIHEIAWH